MIKRKISIALISSVALVAVVSTLLGAFAFAAMRSERDERWARLKEQVAMIADQQAAALSLPLWNVDTDPLRTIMRSAMRDHQVQGIVLHSPQANITLVRDAEWQVVEGARAPAAPELLSERRAIEHGDEKLGEVQVFATPRYLEQDLSARRTFMTLAVIGLDAALVLSLYAVLWQLMLKPLRLIERFAAAVTEGGADSLQARRGRFFGELATLDQSLLDMLQMLDRRFQAMRDSEERLKLATRAGEIGIWDWDIVNNELVWNPEMYAQYGVRREDFSGAFEAWASTLAPEAFNDATLAIKEALAGGREFAREFAILRPDGSKRIIKADSTTLRDSSGRAVRMVGVNIDITERKQAEDAVRELNSELERRVRERTAQLEEAMIALEKARDAAESATRAKSEFLANMSHEIRTPMNAIVGMTHLALRTEMTPKQRDYLSKARLAADSLLRIISDILDFSKIEAGKLEMEARPFLLQDVLDKVTAVVGLKAHEKGLELLHKISPDVPPELVGDSLRLEQVLINLCANAVKFTTRGEIIVSAATKRSPEQTRIVLRFAVRDTGIGMSETQAAGLFQPFNQLDASTTRQYGGTGLGLAICKKLVEMMGGTIEVQSVAGQGSEFSFTASFGILAGDARRTSPSAVLARQTIRDLRVLVVDDSRNSRDIFRDLLRDLGLDPVLVDSGNAAIAELERVADSARYDLVLLDWKMPGLDGFETARCIWALHPKARVPRIVLVTAYGDDELARRALAEGFAGCLDKPVSASTLLDTILAAVGDAQPVTVAEPAAAPAAPPRALAGRKVLLVEDNELNQLIATELLRDAAGMQVSAASNGAEALELLARQPFDIALMDVQMPVMDGCQVTEKIRQQPRFSALPIIAMTAHAMARDRDKCLGAGMNDYITKPVDPAELFKVLAKWLPPVHEPQTLPGASPEAAPAGVSFELGLQRCMGRRELHERVLHRFLETRSDDAREIQAAFARHDSERISSIAHAEISTAGAIGAQGLADAARAIEIALDEGAPDRMPDLIEAFVRHHARALADLQRYLADIEKV
jgi:two-component system, sensor histidine kinase and response regulator